MLSVGTLCRVHTGGMLSHSGVRTENVEDVIRLPPVPLVVTPAGEPSEKERMDTELLK